MHYSYPRLSSDHLFSSFTDNQLSIMLFSRSSVVGFGLRILLLGLSLPTPTLAAHLRRNDYNASSALTLTNNSTIIVNAKLHENNNNATHHKAPLANQQDKTGALEWANKPQDTPAPTYSGVSVSGPMGDQGAGLTDQVPGIMPFATGIVSIPIKDEVVADGEGH